MSERRGGRQRRAHKRALALDGYVCLGARSFPAKQ